MQHSIDHFMWGYQSHFRISQEVLAERVLQELDQRLVPDVFLVGIRVESNPQRHPACVEPEVEFWAKSSMFDSVLEDSIELLKKYPESKLLISSHIGQQRHDERLVRRAIKEDVLGKIHTSKAKPPGFVYFASQPVRVDCYEVMAVLGVEEAILSQHPCLASEYLEMNEIHRIPTPVSFLRATIDVFLEKASSALRRDDPGLSDDRIESSEILREAASFFLSSLACRASPDIIGHTQDFFENCNLIARTFYEQAGSKGRMILAEKSRSELRHAVSFQYPIELRRHRAARKALELASRDLLMHTDSASVFGLVKESVAKRSWQNSDEEMFLISFLDHQHWQVGTKDDLLLDVTFGQPRLPAPEFDASQLEEDLPRIFEGISNSQIDRLVDLVSVAREEEHGTMLVVSSGAKQESERLASQATAIRPKLLSKSLLRNLTGIDGAVLLAPSGTCYAVGVILDGLATEVGDPARGARYNSAVRYVHSATYSSLAVICSEDGGIDFYPRLPPRVSLEEIESRIGELEAIAAKRVPVRRLFSKAIQWLERHSLYLSGDHCDRVNTAVEIYEEKDREAFPMALRVVRDKLVPWQGLKPSLHYK